MNELYNILDRYVVSSRVEGGPRAIVECAITKTPIISTKVGIAEEILSKESIYDNVDEVLNCKINIEYAYNNVNKLTILKCMNKFNSELLKI